jgi:hypothetical protein
MESPQQQLPYTEMIPTNLVDYVSQPLFGKSIEKKVGSTEPMRQLGERVEDRGVVEMDEDGFAPVTKGNRRR